VRRERKKKLSAAELKAAGVGGDVVVRRVPRPARMDNTSQLGPGPNGPGGTGDRGRAKKFCPGGQTIVCTVREEEGGDDA
jgi:hypothetical protein